MQDFKPIYIVLADTITYAKIAEGVRDEARIVWVDSEHGSTLFKGTLRHGLWSKDFEPQSDILQDEAYVRVTLLSGFEQVVAITRLAWMLQNGAAKIGRDLDFSEY